MEFTLATWDIFSSRSEFQTVLLTKRVILQREESFHGVKDVNITRGGKQNMNFHKSGT